MSREVVNKLLEKISPEPCQYWVNIRNVTLEDVNSLLGIYKETTGKPTDLIGEDDFKKLHNEFIGPRGFAEWTISLGSVLEWRRLIGESRIGNRMAEVFVRFKIRELGGSIEDHTALNALMQERVDNYFLRKDKAISMSRII